MNSQFVQVVGLIIFTDSLDFFTCIDYLKGSCFEFLPAGGARQMHQKTPTTLLTWHASFENDCETYCGRKYAIIMVM